MCHYNISLMNEFIRVTFSDIQKGHFPIADPDLELREDLVSRLCAKGGLLSLFFLLALPAFLSSRFFLPKIRGARFPIPLP